MTAIRIVLSVLLIAGLLALGACRPQADTEKVAEFFPNGNPKKVLSYSKNGEIILVTTYHWNRIRHVRQEFLHSVPHGNYERWDSNGDLLERGQYVNGKREGTFELFFRRNNRQGLAEYRDGNKHGKQETYYPNESLFTQEFWDNGVPVGIWKKWDAEGRIQEINSCHITQDTGYIEIRYSSGTIQKREECQKGIRNGAVIENYPNGNPKVRGQNKDGKPHGQWIWTRADSSPWKTLEFDTGLRHGLYLLIGVAGDTMAQTSFKNGNGRVAIPCDSRQPFLCADTSWSEGLLHGNLENWEPEALLLTVENWEKGLPRTTRSWKTDSLRKPTQLLLEGTWINGKREGLWKTWHTNGKLKDSLFYHENELWGTQSYFDSTGHLYMVKETRGKMNQVIIRKLDPKPL